MCAIVTNKHLYFCKYFVFWGIVSFIISSCQDYELTNNEVIIKKSFERNFIETFGEIDPNQSWDLSMSYPRTEAYPIPSYATNTRATDAGEQYTAATDTELNSLITRPGSYENTTEWYQVQTTTLNWLKKELPEGKNNSSKGTAFSIAKPEQQFAIIPIYQGKAKYHWDLHLVDTGNNKDYNIWTKSQGLLIKNPGDTEYHTIDRDWDTSVNGNNCTSGNATDIIAQPIIINSNMIEGEFFLYLDITKTNNTTLTPVGSAQRSDEGMMLSLLCPLPKPSLWLETMSSTRSLIVSKCLRTSSVPSVEPLSIT